MDGERVGVSEAGVVAAGEVSRAAAVTVARSVPNGAAGTIGAGGVTLAEMTSASERARTAAL